MKIPRSPDRKEAFVYLLRCSDESFYCGWTYDIRKRTIAHARGKASKYTRTRLPVRLAYVEKCKDRSTAMKREIKIKRLSRADKILLVEMT